MKLRTKNYIKRQKALRNMFQFDDITSFLMASYNLSRSVVVKKDIINQIIALRSPKLQLAKAS